MVQFRISDPRVIQYWDNDHLVAEALRRQLSSEPSCCQRNGILWDLAVLYGKQAQWGKSSPVFADGPVVDAASDLGKRLYWLSNLRCSLPPSALAKQVAEKRDDTFHRKTLVESPHRQDCDKIASQHVQTEGSSMSDIIKRQKEIVATHIRGENEHDWAAVYDTFVQDDRAHYDVVPLGAVFKGIEGVRGFYQSIAAALPDLQIEVLSEYDVPGCSIREVVITGTHKGEFAGVKPLGNAIHIDMAAFYTFDDASGKLIAEKIYYDQASVLEQMQRKQQSGVA